MPRVSILRFTEDYQMVAEAFKDMVKNAVVTEREEEFGEAKRSVIEIEGDFEHFILEDMDLWSVYLKFEIKDNRIEDADDREARAILSEGMPDFGEVLFSPTITFVFKRVEYKLVTSTVIERVEDDSRVVLNRETQESEPQFEWVDITREFGQKVRINR